MSQVVTRIPVTESRQASVWSRVPLGDICRIDAPIVDPKRSEYCDLPHVNGENIESGTGRLLAVQSAAEDGMTSGKYLFDAGVVLYSKLRPYLQKVVVADFRGLCSADMYPLVFDRDRVDLEFAKYCLLADNFTNFAIEASARARMPKLNREQLLAYELPLPPLAELRWTPKAGQPDIGTFRVRDVGSGGSVDEQEASGVGSGLEGQGGPRGGAG